MAIANASVDEISDWTKKNVYLASRAESYSRLLTIVGKIQRRTDGVRDAMLLSLIRHCIFRH